MDTIHVTLPDGSNPHGPRGTTPAEIARKISQGLAREALVARVDGAVSYTHLTLPTICSV